MSIDPTKYMHIVKAIARSMKRTLPPQVDVEDLESAGYFGLLDAASRYDPGRKTKFETFCVQRIRGAILDELRKLDWVTRLVRQRGEAPVGMKNFSEFTSNKNNPDRDDDEREFVVTDPATNIVDDVELSIRMTSAIASLKPRYQEAVKLYYEEGYTLREAASFMGTTESRVCQILKKALPILRKYLEHN